MRLLVAIFILITTAAVAQKPYEWDYVIRYVRANKMDVTKGTRQIFGEISRNFKGEKQQAEIIRFYSETYDFKIVDKTLLKNAIDSLAVYGMTDEIKFSAVRSREAIENRLLNKKMNDFDFPDVNGKSIKLSSLRDKYVIVELWATWCGPCIKEMQKVPALRKNNPAIEFYSISVDKSPDKMKKFVERNHYDWPIVFGGDVTGNPDLWEYLHIVAIPKYYIVDRSGIVVNVSDRIDEEFIKTLR